MTTLSPTPVEQVSEVAIKVYVVLAREHRGKSKAVPREKLWASIRQCEGFGTVSFREFRHAKYELVKTKMRVGSCHRGWYYIMTPAEARESADYLRPHRDSLTNEIETLELVARSLETPKDPARPPQMDLVPPGNPSALARWPS